MREHKGYQISDDFLIYKGGHRWFTSKAEICNSFDECEILIDSYLMARELFWKMPNLSKVDILEILEDENGTQDRDDADRWSENQHEQELINHEENY